MKNYDLINAQKEKKDEFYTQYQDIKNEIMRYWELDHNVFYNKTILLPCDDPELSNFTKFFILNFNRFKLKKIISTCYSQESKLYNDNYQLSLFETNDFKFDEYKSNKYGKIFILNQDEFKHNEIDINNLKWSYLQGNGDFRSSEIKKLRDESDIIITNPPFSLFREFISWIFESDKKFIIMGNLNAITYKNVFPLIKNNKMWLGHSIHSGDIEFEVSNEYTLKSYRYRIDNNTLNLKENKNYYKKYIRVKGVRWFTNIDHGYYPSPIQLMSMADNIKYSSHKEIRENGYQKYDNYNAIEVPYTDAIPSDYDGVMGVPISFLDKYNPNQFEILGMDNDVQNGDLIELANPNWHGTFSRGYVNGIMKYCRILIKKI